MINRIALAAAAAVLPLAVIAPAHAAIDAQAPSSRVVTLTTHCVMNHCRQREVTRAPFVLGGTAVYWQHRDWSLLTGYGRWSTPRLHRVV